MSTAPESNLSKAEIERAARVRSARLKKIKRIFIWVLVLAVIAGAVWGLVIWSKKAEANKPGAEITPMTSRDHIPETAPKPDYSSNPPTSGPHWATPANWGVYDKELADQQLVHNLEHGGIWISYKDAADTALVDQLKSIANEYSLKVIMTPRAADPDRIDVAAWGRLLRLDQFDGKQIRDFIGAFINRGPEQVPY